MSIDAADDDADDAVEVLAPRLDRSAARAWMNRHDKWRRAISENRHRHWTGDEDAALRRSWPNRQRSINAVPGRSWTAIRKRAARLGLVRQLSLPWTDEERAIVVRWWGRASSRRWRELLPRRSAAMVLRQARAAGLTDREIAGLVALVQAARAIGVHYRTLRRAAEAAKLRPQHRRFDTGCARRRRPAYYDPAELADAYAARVATSESARQAIAKRVLAAFCGAVRSHR